MRSQQSTPEGRTPASGNPASGSINREPLPRYARETTAHSPWPVRLLSEKIRDYVERMSPVWIEGQVVQLNRRAKISFLTLRDTDLDVSLPVSAFSTVLAKAPELHEGDRVVVYAKPAFWTKRGTLQLQAAELRHVGIGELLARIEQLKRTLAGEGLFDPDRKQPLPFLPSTIGLVCGRESKAEHDVVVNARARWHDVRFEIREVAVQGTQAVSQVVTAIAELDADPAVDVVVVARGGGAVEDLLPFSNETLVRAVAACRTPVVSAIGHETDNPLLDLVADLRASTPTDAAKRIVPDIAEERRGLADARSRLHSAARAIVEREQQRLDAMRTRPVLAAPVDQIDAELRDLANTRSWLRAHVAAALDRDEAVLARLRAQVTALSPASTLTRGYAVLQTGDGTVVREADAVTAGTSLSARLAHGSLALEVLDEQGIGDHPPTTDHQPTGDEQPSSDPHEATSDHIRPLGSD